MGPLELIRIGKQRLADVSETPQLDAEVLLCFLLDLNRTYLYTHPELTISDEKTMHYMKILSLREEGMPVAYITGHQEFWSLNLIVNPHVLIPRPETEMLVDIALELLPHQQKQRIADLGTGSGAIALALAVECPLWEIHAVDNNDAAIQVAYNNAIKHNVNTVIFHHGSWCEPLPKVKFHSIISNPPYIASEDPELSSSTNYEPRNALIAAEQGLKALYQIAIEARQFLQNGYLILEHGYEQKSAVKKILKNLGYKKINTRQDLAGKDRVTYAIFS